MVHVSFADHHLQDCELADKNSYTYPHHTKSHAFSLHKPLIHEIDRWAITQSTSNRREHTLTHDEMRNFCAQRAECDGQTHDDQTDQDTRPFPRGAPCKQAKDQRRREIHQSQGEGTHNGNVSLALEWRMRGVVLLEDAIGEWET